MRFHIDRLIVFSFLALLPLVSRAQNSYSGFYGENGAGGIYTSVNGGQESAPAPAMVSVSRTNIAVFAVASITPSATNWLSVGGVQTTFVNPKLYYYFDPSSSGYTPNTGLSNLVKATFPHPFAWFSTNAAGIWFLRATNTMVSGAVTNVYRLEATKTREQPPTLVDPKEGNLNYIVYQHSDPQPYIGSANGDALQFQWQRSSAPTGPWTNIQSSLNPTATNDYLTLIDCTAGDAGYFHKIISNSGGSVTSTWAVLTVNTTVPALSFTSAGDGITNRAGWPELTGNGSGYGPFVTIGPATKNWGYWRKNGVPTPPFGLNNNVRTYSPFLYQTNAAPLNNSGSLFSAFSANYLLPADSGNWDFVVFDALGRSLTSSVVRIVITNAPGALPAIALEPKDQTNTLGGTAIFRAGASGIPPITYQWFKENGTPLVESTNALHVTSTNLWLTYLKPGDDTGYYMVATDLNSASVTSRVAGLTLAQKPVFTLNPVDTSTTEGGSATFNVTVSCNVPFTLNWLANGSIYDSTATNSTYTLTNVSSFRNKSRISVQAQTVWGVAYSTEALLSVSSTGLVATYRGQPWVKILDTDMRVPGYTNLFTKNNELISPYRGAWDNTSRPAFTLRNRTIHLSVPAGVQTFTNQLLSSIVQRAIVRWRSNVLETLVFTNTTAPDGFKFVSLGETTDEEDGAIDFTGFTTNSPQAIYELRNGVVTAAVRELVDLWPTGPGFIDGIYALVRRGSTLIFSANSTDLKPGGTVDPTAMFAWKGPGQLTTVVDETTDLPGRLSNFSGVLFTTGSSHESVAFDGTNIAFIGTAASGNTVRKGCYVTDLAGNLTKVADDGDIAAGFANTYTNFAMCDLRDGIVRFTASSRAYQTPLGGSVSSAGYGSVFFGGTGPAGYLLNGNSVTRQTGPVADYVLSTPPSWVIDGRRVSMIKQMRSDGPDIVVDVQFEDGSAGIYANFAPAVPPTPGTPVTLGPVTLVGGNLSFTFPTQAGAIYRIERAYNLPTSFWSYVDTVSGDGTDHQITTDFRPRDFAASFFRVVVLP